MHIKDFSNGDLICRTEPAKRQEERENENLGSVQWLHFMKIPVG